MATTKIRGADLTMTFDGIDLSSASREISITGEADEIDASTRDDVVAGASQYLPGPVTWEFEATGLDTTGGHAAIKTIQIGDTGTLVINTGQASTTVTAVILSQEYTSPHDDVAEWTLGGRLNAAPVWA